MLWLVINGESHQIIGCNTHERNGKHQLWVERVNGKTMLISESKDKDEIDLVKDAIDYAIENKDNILRLS